MKKISSFVAVTMFSLLCFMSNAKAQTGNDYFLGKWDVMVKGLPQGDTKMLVNLERKDTTVAGAILDSAGTTISEFSKVEMKDSTVTVYFTAQGYDVYLRLDKKGDDHVTGTMLDMFDAEGDRVKAAK